MSGPRLMGLRAQFGVDIKSVSFRKGVCRTSVRWGQTAVAPGRGLLLLGPIKTISVKTVPFVALLD